MNILEEKKVLDPNYSSIGVVFKTDSEEYKIVETKALDSLQSQIQELKSYITGSFHRGSITKLNNSNIDGVLSVVTYDKRPTDEVIVKKSVLEGAFQGVNSGSVNNNMILNFSNQIASLKKEVDKLKSENQSLKADAPKISNKEIDRLADLCKELNSKLDKSSHHAYELQLALNNKEKEIKDLNEKLSSQESAPAVSNLQEKAQEARRKKSDELAALILGFAIQGYSATEIKDILESSYNKVVALSTIYSAISVKEDTDRQRIKDLYVKYTHLFNRVTEKDLIRWFDNARVRKMKLIPKSMFQAMFFGTELPERDKYVTDEYYSVQNMNMR